MPSRSGQNLITSIGSSAPISSEEVGIDATDRPLRDAGRLGMYKMLQHDGGLAGPAHTRRHLHRIRLPGGIPRYPQMIPSLHLYDDGNRPTSSDFSPSRWGNSDIVMHSPDGSGRESKRGRIDGTTPVSPERSRRG